MSDDMVPDNVGMFFANLTVLFLFISMRLVMVRIPASMELRLPLYGGSFFSVAASIAWLTHSDVYCSLLLTAISLFTAITIGFVLLKKGRDSDIRGVGVVDAQLRWFVECAITMFFILLLVALYFFTT